MKITFFTIAGYIAVCAVAGAAIGATAVYLYEKGKEHHRKKLAKAKNK